LADRDRSHSFPLVDFDSTELELLRTLFRDEAHEALERVTHFAQSAAGADPGADAVNAMMRITHTLKGAAGTVGVDAVAELTHRLEGALHAVRAGQRPWTRAFGAAVVEIADGLRAYVDRFGEPGAADAIAARVGELLEPWSEGPRLRAATTPPPPARPPATVPIAVAVMSAAATADEPVRAVGPVAAGELELAASDGVVAEIDDSPSTASVISADASTYDTRTLLRVEPERVDALMSAAGELLFDCTRIERRVQLLRTVSRDLGRARQGLRDELGGVAGGTTGDRERHQLEDRLRGFEEQVATVAAQLAQTSAALLDETEAMRKNLAELQGGLTRVRMQTARALFTQLARALRAAARAAGTDVELRTSGDDTEFDKTVAERITDPLIQLLRNAVVHGIEPRAERVLRGKSATGVIRISARHDGNLLVLELSDDGRGVDARRLRERFVATGRWTAAKAELASDDDVIHALFDHGVSSRDEADELAGRGIGLDLVREAIARLGGEIRMTSTPGRGTSFLLRLPVSTAVTQAMLFKVHGQVYALPNAQVVEVVAVDGEAGEWPAGGAPVVRLERLLAIASATASTAASTAASTSSSSTASEPARRPGIVVTYAGHKLVCTVDRVIGAREIVVKQFGPLLAPLSLYAGATISGSGKVQLILDPAALVRTVYPSARLAESAPPPATLDAPAGRALVVDDSRALREALSSMLAREGWIVDVAEDGERAWSLAEHLTYDLVVTDLEMPRVSGFELIARLRRARRTEQIAIVIVSSRVTPDVRRRAAELNVKGVIAKPLTRRKLLDVLHAELPRP
jgi:chemotaxis protein histidine kinase CheA/CheY-like chemotaxis protein